MYYLKALRSYDAVLRTFQMPSYTCYMGRLTFLYTKALLTLCILIDSSFWFDTINLHDCNHTNLQMTQPIYVTILVPQAAYILQVFYVLTFVPKYLRERERERERERDRSHCVVFLPTARFCIKPVKRPKMAKKCFLVVKHQLKLIYT